MADSCIISKEQLSQKEQSLKARLYGGGVLQPTGTQVVSGAAAAS
jgi:hypothetical protein